MPRRGDERGYNRKDPRVVLISGIYVNPVQNDGLLKINLMLIY